MTSLAQNAQKFFRSFRLQVNKEDKIGFDLQLKTDQSARLVDHKPSYELVNLSLTGLAYITDYPFELGDQLTATVVIKKKSFEFSGEIVRVARYAEKAGCFVFGVKLNRISDESARLFIESLVHYFSAKRLKNELVNLMANEVELELPQLKDLMALMEGLYSELKRFEHNRGFAETLCLQSENLFPDSLIKVYKCNQDSSELLEQIIPLQSGSLPARPLTQSFEMAKYKQVAVVDKETQALIVPLFSQIGILLGFLEISPSHEKTARWSETELLMAEYIGFMICSLILDCLFDTNIDTICLQPTENRRKYALIGESETMSLIRSSIEKLKHKTSHTVIAGPPGVGKELLAKIIHTESANGRMPYGVLDARDLLGEVSQLKSYLIGSAHSIGKLELYTGGCLILKGVDVLPSHVLEELTEILESKSELRIILTTQQTKEQFLHNCPRSLLSMLKKDQMDIEFLELKALKEHHEDIPYLVRYFLRQCSIDLGLIPKKVSTEIIEQFMNYNWPSNYRELKLAVERLVSMNKGINFIKRLPPHGVTLFDQYARQRQVFEQLVLKYQLSNEERLRLLQRFKEEEAAAEKNSTAA